MGKRTSQLTQLTAAQVAQGDYLPIVDVSAGQTKYVTVKDLTGLPDLGWTTTGESWSFSSWNSTTKIGVITVPTDATIKYNKGMWVMFSQATGGVKYGYIVAVTSTTITINLFNIYTLNNEAISSPVYSPLYQPIGTPALPVVYTDAAGWKVVDHGKYKEWWIDVAKNVSLAANSRDAGTAVTTPTGLTDLANANVKLVAQYNGSFGGHGIAGIQTNNVFMGSAYSGGALTFTGEITLHVVMQTETY